MEDLTPTTYRKMRLNMRMGGSESPITFMADRIFIPRHRIVAQLKKLGMPVPDNDDELLKIFEKLLHESPEKLTPREIIDEVG